MEKEGREREKVTEEVTDDTGKVTDTSTLLLVASLRSFEVTKFQNIELLGMLALTSR